MDNAPDPISTHDDLTVPWWVVAIFVVAFVALAAFTAGTNTIQLDLSVTEQVQRANGQVVHWVADFGNLIGESTNAVGVLVAGVVAMAVLKRWRELWFLLVAALLRSLAAALKGLIESPRPTAEQVTLHEVFDGFGFPSGHVTTSAVLVGTLAFLAARLFPTTPARTAALALWIVGMATTVYARIWVGAHWFTDTIGGALAGVTIVLVAANLSAMITNRMQSTSRTAPAQTPAP